MGRPRKTDRHLPKLFYQKRRCYWFAGTKPWTNLGSDFASALDEYYTLLGLRKADIVRATTWADLSRDYRALGMTELAERTRSDYLKYLAHIDGVFGHMNLKDIEPGHVFNQHKVRGKTARVTANREKACMSLVWNWGRQSGRTKLPNPCTGVKRFHEQGRTVVIDADTYFAVWTVSGWDLRDAMDLAWHTGQRPADVMKAHWSDVRDGYLRVRQNKTSQALRIKIEGQLFYLLADVALRRGTSGKIIRATYSALDNQFEDARRKVGVGLDAFQFRDLRARAGAERADQEGDLRKAQQLLGHTNITTTERYASRRLGNKVRPVE